MRWLLPITLGVILGPAPEIGASILERQLCLPAELLGRSGGVARQIEDIAGSAPDDLVRQIAADSFAKRLDHFKDGGAAAGAEIPGAHTRVVGAQVVEGLEVALGQVEDVDVIADGGAVVGGVVVAKDEEFLALPGCDLRKERE